MPVSLQQLQMISRYWRKPVPMPLRTATAWEYHIISFVYRRGLSWDYPVRHRNRQRCTPMEKKKKKKKKQLRNRNALLSIIKD